jgi:hypothetical protein
MIECPTKGTAHQALPSNLIAGCIGTGLGCTSLHGFRATSGKRGTP